MFQAVAVVNGAERKSKPVVHVHEARALAQAMFAWAKAKGAQLRSVKVVRVPEGTPAPAAVAAPAAPAAPAKRRASRKAAGGAA